MNVFYTHMITFINECRYSEYQLIKYIHAFYQYTCVYDVFKIVHNKSVDYIKFNTFPDQTYLFLKLPNIILYILIV